ncbi:MAG TPA: hypothetical protein QF564_15420 [Pirellulaceae bacterium]|nr:hypothetical protein [Pirellulaceae bacterium]
MRLLKPLSVMICFLFVAMDGLRAQEAAAPAASQPPAVDPVADDPVAAVPSTPLREQSIYIPYNKLREVFEQQGRGVFLPYDKFQELWRTARAQQDKTPEAKPPVGALIAEIRNEATVEKDVVSVSATLKIELLSQGWHQIPLRLSDAALRSATIADAPAHVTFDTKQGYRLLIHHDQKEPAQIELLLDYAKAYAKSPGQNSVTFQAPQASINRWQIRIPQRGVKVNVQPLIAATELPPSDPPAEGEAPVEETVVQAFVGAAPTIRVDWTPKAEGASGLEALATVQAEQEVTIDEGVIRTRTRLTYDISRAELTQLQVEVPAEHKVTGVFDPNVRKWEVKTDEAKENQTITIELFQPARGQQKITVELERFVTDAAMLDLPVPTVKALNVARQQGILVARVVNELRGEAASRTGLSQLDAAELPKSLQGQKWLAAYRYSILPFELILHVEKVEPRIRAVQYVEVFLEPQLLTVDLLAVFTIERAGVFELEFDVPPGYTVRQVRGDKGTGAAPVVVDSHQLEGENNSRLTVNLSAKAIGKVGVFITLERSLDDANLLTPTGESSTIPLPIPRVAMAVEQLKGGVIVYAPESLRVNPNGLQGLRTVSFAEARQDDAFIRGGRLPALREVLGLAHANEDLQLALDVQRRQPHVTARQFLAVSIESGVVHYSAHFFYDILYSGVKDLRIDIPSILVDKITNKTQAIRDATITPQPDDVADGYTAWSFTGEGEFLGSTQFLLTWQENVEELTVNNSTQFAIPVLRPVDVNRAWGQIVVAKAETLEVLPTKDMTKLRPIDPQLDLMPGVPKIEAARAFEFQDDWSLSVSATRYELQDVKRTSIERAVLRVVVTRSDKISVQALYRLRSAVQRLAVKLPDHAAFDPDPLRINGAARGLEEGDQDQNFIPMSGHGPDTSVLVELRYTVDGDQGDLSFPIFPAQADLQSEPAMQKVVMCVYLPEQMALLESRGPWTHEQAGWYQRLNYPIRTNDNDYLDWVTEGVPLENTGYRSFPTHGRLYAFTTLRPPPPPDGSLRLWAVSENGVNGVLLSVLFVVGVVFLPRSFSAKLFALALLLIGVVLAGVFAPTLAMQIIDTWLAVGVALVVFVWIVAAVYTSRNQLSAVFARATATRAETETQSAAATQSDDSSVAEDVTAEEGTGAADGDLETDEQGGSPFAGEPTDDDHNTQGGETNA